MSGRNGRKMRVIIAIGMVAVMAMVPSGVIWGSISADQTSLGTAIGTDTSFPQIGDYDYAVFNTEVSVSNQNPVSGDNVEITADIHNLGLTFIGLWHANPADDYNGEWVEYDFYQPVNETLNITARATDRYCPDTYVSVNFFLDGPDGKIASFQMYENTQWQLLTAYNVSVEKGWHTLRVTMVYGEVPRDLYMDWVEIGSLHIEAENYNRTGGTGAPQWNGVDSIYPRNVVVRFYDGDPAAGGVLIGETIPGKTNNINDWSTSPYHFDVNYIENNGVGTAKINWTATEGTHDIYVSVDPDNNVSEINETNNRAHITLTVAPSTDVDLSISDSDISFSEDYPSAGENITISATIHGDYDIWNTTTESETLFSDNFDDGTLNKWYVGPWNPDGIMETTNAVSHSPDYCAHSQSDPNTNTAPYIRASYNESDNILLEGWIYLPQKAQEYDRFRILQANNRSAEYLIGLMLFDNNYSLDLIEDTTTNTDLFDSDQKIMNIYEFQPETWYKIGLRINGLEYSVYVNDSLIYSGTRTKSIPLDTVFFGDAGGDSGVWGDAYLDDVTVTGYRDVQTIEHRAQNATCTVSFYLDEVNESNLIYSETGVFVPANGEVTVQAPWSAVEGNHTIIVKVTDVSPEDRDYSNNMAAKAISASLKYPDLSISSEDISYSFNNSACACPCEWDTINISAEVHNIGNEDARCTVSFYIDEVAPAYMIYREYEVYVPAGNSTTVSYEWSVHINSIPDITGNHSLIVNISDSAPPEQNLENNQASTPITIDELQEKLKVKASTDKQKYIKGVDTGATVIVKVTSRGELIDNATVRVWVTDPNGDSIEVAIEQQASGIYTGTYEFTETSPLGTYRIKATAEKNGYISGENNDAKDKFFLKNAGCGKTVGYVGLSSHIVGSDEDSVTITAEITDYQTVSAVFAEIRKHKDSLDVRLPLYDDASHGDVILGDGTFTGILDISGFTGTYTVTIWVDDMPFENVAGFSVQNDNRDILSIQTISELQSNNGTLHVVSEATNTTLDLSLAHDLSNVSFTIVEHRTSGDGKSIEIIPTENIDSAMISAQIKVKYTDSDIPNGTNESDIRIYVFNVYTETWEICTPGGVSICEDLVWGQTKHFSNFTFRSAPYVYTTEVHQDWNLLTLPWLERPDTIENALYSVSWDRAMVYLHGQWFTYNKDRDAKYNLGFPLVDNTMGIWVHLTSAGTLRGSYDEQIVSTKVHLDRGWNLIGYPSASDLKVSDVFSGIPWEYLQGADANGNLYYLSAADYLVSGRSYWVYVTEACDITVNW